MNKLLISAAVVIGVMSAVPAFAGLVPTSPSCSSGNALTAMNPDALACLGAFDGNDANQRPDMLSEINGGFASYEGAGNWTFIEKADEGQNGTYLPLYQARRPGEMPESW